MSKKSKKSILFLGKKEDKNTIKASEYIVSNFEIKEIHLGKWGDPFPKSLSSWKGDYIISYLSRWILPQGLLDKAKNAAINFHPASPDYPGVGCNNFALYNNEEYFGVTCHHMTSKIDSGQIIATKKFSILPSDDVSSLLLRTYNFQLELFYEVVHKILHGEELGLSGEKWTREPFTREELNQLLIISSEMDEKEIKRRIRATSFNKWKPYLKIGDLTFEYKDE